MADDPSDPSHPIDDSTYEAPREEERSSREAHKKHERKRRRVSSSSYSSDSPKRRSSHKKKRRRVHSSSSSPAQGPSGTVYGFCDCMLVRGSYPVNSFTVMCMHDMWRTQS